MVKLISSRKSFTTFLIRKHALDKLESEVQVVLAMLTHRQHARQSEANLPITEMLFLLQREENTASDNGRPLRITVKKTEMIHSLGMSVRSGGYSMNPNNIKSDNFFSALMFPFSGNYDMFCMPY